jgi:NAD(P)-dependent dehydrogenase (short-subunit alcohol dehydrogenase family)
LDLADLTTVKPAAEAFKAKESRLDTLTNNAGIMTPPRKSKTAQGHDLQLGTNCLGPWLFTQHLVPLLQKTATESPKNSVRVTWAASLATWYSPKNGVAFDKKTQQPKIGLSVDMNYGQSKAGNIYMASEFAKRYGKDGIVSVSWNPGNLRTELVRHANAWKRVVMWQIMYPAKNGAYTELYAACSPEITLKDGGSFIAPFGRQYKPRSDIQKGLKEKSEGGSGVAIQFVDWVEKETKAYL